MPAPCEIRRTTVVRQSLFAASVLALLLAGSESLSYGVGPLPPTPCPCAADGICRPNRASWGFSRTRWRAWPGEEHLGQQPKPGDGITPGAGDEQALPPYEAPLPEQEDLRGQAKEKSKKTAGGNAEDAANEEPAIQFPGPEALPGFDPEGRNFPDGDAPPALPASLRQAALSSNMPQLAARRLAPATGRAALKTSTRSSTTTTGRTVRPASWHQSSIGLINPAAAIVAPDANGLQQAIYYEASDSVEYPGSSNHR